MKRNAHVIRRLERKLWWLDKKYRLKKFMRSVGLVRKDR